MLPVTIFIITIFVLFLVFLKPKRGAIFLWPMLFMYPHYLMWQKSLLPLNIGIDDLFICVFFIVVFFRKNILGQEPIRFGYSCWTAFFFLIILIVININGYYIAGAIGAEGFVKRALKGFITLMLTYSIVNSIDDVYDLREIIFAYCFFACFGAVLVILQNYFPVPMRIFSSPFEIERTWLVGVESRPSGAFLNANNAAVVMGVTIILTIATMPVRSYYYTTSVRYLIVLITFLAILITRSRSGFISSITPLFFMSIFGKGKKYIWPFIIAGILLMLVLGGIRTALFERFGSQGAATPGVAEPLRLRYEAVLSVWETVTFRRLLWGQEELADVMLGRLAPHTDYLGTPLRYGIFGTFWTIYFFYGLYKRAKIMKWSADPQLKTIAEGILWCMISFALYAIVGGLFNNYYIRYTLFLLAAIVQRGSDFAQEGLLSYDGQTAKYEYESSSDEANE